MKTRLVFLGAAVALAWPGLADGQGAAPAAAPIDPASIAMPDLAFTPTPEIERNYDKYFVFNRADTDFATAYADLRECDGFARGLAYFAGAGAAAAQAGIITGLIAEVGSDLLYGSAERRKQRRQNMLTCMRFKAYRVFGLPERIWETFNFEEGNSIVPENARQRMLQVQARVASGPAPARLSSLTVVPVVLRAADKQTNLLGLYVDRHPAIAGVLRYQRDEVIDERTGQAPASLP